MKTSSISGILAAASLLAGASASAVVVNIDFGLQGIHPDGVVSELYSGTAAAPDAGTVWNAVTVAEDASFAGPPGKFGFWTASVSVPNLLDSAGNVTSLTVTANASGPNGTGAFGVLQGSTNLQAVATDAVGLMRDYLIGFGDPRSVVLGGFTPGTLVDLYLYGAGDTSNRDTAFTVVDINGTHSATTTGTITSDANNPQSHVLTLGGDYVVLNGLVADGAGEITILYDNGAGSDEGPFNGLQAVFAIPEPASALLLLGGLPLMFRRRRVG